MSVSANLPQHDDANKRRTYLDKMRKLYAYHYSYNSTFATVIKLPDAEKVDCRYRFASIKNLGRLIPRLPSILSTQLKYWFGCSIDSFNDYLFFGRNTFPDTRFLDNFLSDEYFGLQRAIGINHVLLQRVTDSNPIPKSFDISTIKHEFAEIVKDASFDEAMKHQRLYFVDYVMLQGLVEQPGEYKGRKQYVTAPIVLLYCLADGTLRPIGIQLNQQMGCDNPVFTPLDEAWSAAKLFAQIADVNYQEFVTHATRIHYLVESFVIAAHRELYKDHPVFLLLKPHLEYTLSVNAHHLFLKNAKGVAGDFGAQLAGNYDSMISLMSEAFTSYDFAEHALPKDIEKRGVDSKDLFYPYAEEGKQIWDMTQKFVLDYLNLYYSDEKLLAGDNEIQNWARVMASDNGMRIKGFPSQFETVEQLAQAVGQIIFITTAHHSSIHYPQYQFSGFTPAMPFAAYAPPPTKVDIEYSERDLLNILPLRQPSLMQAFIFYLTDFRLGHLGEYKRIDDRAKPLVKAYQDELEALSAQLDLSDISRAYPYIYLNPKHIPSSVMV
ncbi:lipoxygenase family protein [Candidatus Albibeggiatoa sp. nov. BB20]|uniref:lipoxygenase family protein n=1 Tax=Candidatus Albibeggiatoa sp. nov. BB20 TaxID=3162723 RepID=UPI00336567A3